VTETPAFRYRAIANDGRTEEIFTSNVEYFAGDELTLGGASWTVERVEQEGIEHEDGDAITVRTLYCVI
jgi:hypothetical protein